MSNDYNGKKRSELPDSVFGIPQERKYPMPDEKHTRSAIKLFNHVDPKYEEQLAKAVIKNMKKYGIDGSVVGPNNRLRKYLPKDMIKESAARPLIYTWERANIPEYSVIQESSHKSDFSYSVINTSTEKSEFKRNFREVFKEDPTESSVNYMQMIKYKGDLVGYIGFSRYKEGKKKYLGIGNFMILKRYQHSGMGSKVISDIIDRYKDNYDEIYCYVDKDNTNAIAFYKKIAKVNTDNLTKYGYYVTLYSKSIGESAMLEGYLKSDKDIYYNKDKFDSGEINLCFITGLSGSGKSTMGRGMSSKDVEHYEMDDIICNYAFSDDNLKEYGGLVESFFKGPGKEYRLKRGDEDHNNAVFDSHENYEKEITHLFVKHAISYCKSHKRIKYICDGIWIFMFIKPEQLKDCAVYIKGTSSIKSGYRALKRDIDEDKRNGMTSLQIFKHEFKRVKEDILYAKENQKELKSFRSYFEKQLTNESYVEESSHNKVYHLSQTNLDGKTIQPTVPSNYMTKNGYEDGKTKRVCFATSIDGCLRGLSLKCEGMKLFVHVPDGNYNIYKPSNKEVPDANITGEVWIKKAVKMKCIGQIYVIGDKGEDGIPYKYGDKTAELYDWEWKWIDRFNESSSILPQDTGISTVIFDLGDVLVSANIKDYLIADPEVPNEIVDELLKLWFIDKDEVDDTMDLDTYREIVNKRMGVEFSKYTPKLFKYNVECVTAFNYTIPMIQDLKDKGYKVYYLSNWSAWTYDLLQEAGKFDFLKLMDGGVFSYDAGYMKPNEEIYKILLNKYKINPEEAVFFDDREENIEAANKLGIHGIHFPRHDSSIVYNSLKVLQTSNEMANEVAASRVVLTEEIIQEELAKYSIAIENQHMIAKASIKVIEPVILNNNKYHKQAKDLGLRLRCDLLPVKGTVIDIRVLDGYKNCEDSDSAKQLLDDIKESCVTVANKLSGTFRYYVEEVTTDDKGCLNFHIKKMKVVSYNSDNEVMKEEDMEYPDFPVVLNIDSDITTVDIDKTLKESSIQEYGTTGGTIVGANQPDSVYIVNYMQNNVFSGYKEPKQAICKKGMNQMYTTKNGKAIPVDIDKFKEEASDISVFRFKETPILSFDKIIENASVDGDFYMLLTGDYPANQHEIEYDNRFVQEENFFDKLDDITYCTESTIIGQIEVTDYPYMKILTESMEGRCWNYYRDINGVFAMNELTGLRTPSYEDITDIPNSQIQLIERGTVYFGD